HSNQLVVHERFKWLGRLISGETSAQVNSHRCSRFALGPTVDHLKQTVAFREIRRLTRHWIPRHVPHAPHGSAIATQRVKVAALSEVFGDTDARHSRGREWNGSFISDFQLY